MTNRHLVKIFDLTSSATNDSKLGPVNQQFFTDLIFGQNIHNIKHTGFIGSEFCKYMKLCNVDKGNTYNWNFDHIEYDNNIIEFYNNLHKKIFNEHVISLYSDAYDLIAQDGSLKQFELRNRLKIPKNITGDNAQNDRMISELVNRMEYLNIVKTENPTKNSRIIYPIEFNPNNLSSTFILKPYNKNKSKLEVYINRILHDLLLNYDNLNHKWSVRLNEYKKAPYDFGIYNNNKENLIGLIEVDGDQHYNKRNYLHKDENSFNKRIEIDEKKNHVAENNDIKLHRIREDFIRNNKEKIITNNIKTFIDDLL